MQFAYVAMKGAERVTGTAEAADRFALSRALKADGLTVISAEEAKSGSSRNWFAWLNSKFSTLSMKERIFFANNMAEMLEAGLPLSRALKVSGRQTKNPKMRAIVEGLRTDVDQGGSFAGALNKYPALFPETSNAMIEAGERSGRIPESLRLIGTQMMKTYKLRKRVKGAMIYPAIIIGAMILIAVLMMIYVVPTLASTFEELGAELPATTKLIIFASDLLMNHYIGLIIGIITVVVAFWYSGKVPPIKRFYAWLVLHMPVFGGISKKANSALTARTLSSLLLSGVDIVQALEITKKVVGNVYFRDIIAEASVEMPKGKSLSSIFSRPDVEKIYPPFMAEMITVGEETGKLPEMLTKLAVFYEGEVDAVVKDLSTIIEPFIMLLVGLGVGFFALSMIQPIYQVGNSI